MKGILQSIAALAVLLSVMVGCQATNRAMGENRGDATITAAVKERIVKDRAGNLTSVNVDTDNGTVYLRGHVPTTEDKMRAGRLAQGVDGVDRVVNELRISSASETPSSRDMR